MSSITMTERPIIMGGESVLGILKDYKTHTRRVIKPQPNSEGDIFPHGNDYGAEHITSFLCLSNCPYGQIGDRLWVREQWRLGTSTNCPCGVAWLGGTGEHARVVPHPDAPSNAEKWNLRWIKRSPLFMPR